MNPCCCRLSPGSLAGSRRPRLGGQGLLELLLHLPQGLGVRGEPAETQAQGLGEAGLLGTRPGLCMISPPRHASPDFPTRTVISQSHLPPRVRRRFTPTSSRESPFQVTLHFSLRPMEGCTVWHTGDRYRGQGCLCASPVPGSADGASERCSLHHQSSPGPCLARQTDGQVEVQVPTPPTPCTTSADLTPPVLGTWATGIRSQDTGTPAHNPARGPCPCPPMHKKVQS